VITTTKMSHTYYISDDKFAIFTESEAFMNGILALPSDEGVLHTKNIQLVIILSQDKR
jgi:hypothetical protein